MPFDRGILAALSSTQGSRYYRSLREHGESDVQLELSSDGEGPGPQLKRRELTALLGASLALAGLTSCARRPPEKILPYVRAPLDVKPGVPIEYATTMTLGGFGTGLIGTVQDGRPIKLDGNPEHPAALGGSGIYEQAALLGLYDPARLSAPLHGGIPSDWHAVTEAIRSCGPRTWFVLPPQSSPLVAQLLAQIHLRLPLSRFVHYQPLPRQPVYAAARSALGRRVETHYRLADCRVVLALDADFTANMPGSLRMARDLGERRRQHTSGSAQRLYVAEAMLSPSGSLADHRLAVESSRVPLLARAVLQQLHELGMRVPGMDSQPWSSGDTRVDAFARAVARDLAQARGEAVVLVGERQPAETHVLGHAINQALGGFGRTLYFAETSLLEPEGQSSIEDLAGAIAAGEVDALAILEENPVFSAPPRLALRDLLPRVPLRFHLTDVENETSRLCPWRLPLSHFLESWGDARALDGTVSYAQPLIAPRHASRSSVEVLALFADRREGALELLRGLHQSAAQLSETDWEQRLQAGFASGSASPAVDVTLNWEAVNSAVRVVNASAHEAGALEVSFTLGNVHDGRFVNNAWLLELPHPMTKQCWGNAAVVSPATAARLGLQSGDVIAVTAQGQRLEVPALILPGHADGALSLDVGYGSASDGLGHGVGVNAYTLRSGTAQHFSAGARIERTTKRVELALTQEHFRLQGRDYVKSTSLEEYRSSRLVAPEQRLPQHSLLPTLPSAGTQWAMSIDTDICSGCSACVVACQAENNVPVVGKRGVMKSREMHWLRIDRYFEGDVNAPRVVNQPMLCQHCEKAPCEYVCPVNATVHSPDGLNEMVYNRCIGTRFCSNNCPYKVRRFNWFDYSAEPSTPTLQKNPEVTVRERGVMEKCTFCVQRIRRAEQRALAEGRPSAANEVVTACQAACPTKAIQFGSLASADSPLRRLREDGRSYAALHELGTRPRVTYLARVRNRNAELEK